MSGECVDWVCEPGEDFCSGNSVHTCADDGLSSEEVEVCAEGHYCDAATAECTPGLCAPGEPTCVGNLVRDCNAQGDGYESGGVSCAAGTSCEGGDCKEQVCTPGATFCQGQDVKLCAENGLSSPVEETCEDQACVENGESAACQGECAPGQTQCSGNGVQACDASGEWSAVVACEGTTPHCSAGVCGQPPSCESLTATCGPNGNESCCTSLPVAGGTFYRGADTSYPANISDFRLDKYEVTVGRFRKFAAAWNDGFRPAAGAGKHTHLNGGAGLAATAGGNEPGWDTAWESDVDTSDTARAGGDTTWTSSAGSNENLPINYVNWYESAAFCIWDGGFLASEAEWEYAAAGGAEERTYPWGETTPTCDHANFSYNDSLCEAGAPHSAPVGKRSPTGDGLRGQSDLSGNVWEWVLDWDENPYSSTCNNCATTTVASYRVLRGGSWGDDNGGLTAAGRFVYYPPTTRNEYLGLRCARTP